MIFFFFFFFFGLVRIESNERPLSRRGVLELKEILNHQIKISRK